MDESPSSRGIQSRSYAINGKIMMSAIVVLFAVVVFLLFLHIYVRWLVIRRSSRRDRLRHRGIPSDDGQSLPPSSVHRQLDPLILASLPVLLFSGIGDEGGDEEFGECAVCLNEFEEGEKVRCLPRCGHRFHIDCIDMWFFSHSTCPLCRSAVKAVKEAEAPCSCAIAPVEPSAATVEVEMGSSSSAYSGGEVGIDVPTEGFSGREEQVVLGFESPAEQNLKSASGRIELIRRLLMGNPRFLRDGSSGSEPDMERGVGAARPPPPPPP
ncbi:hypothetical protein HPP92_002724 [Vanilla planifolia]|uniref:RING-type E3 ubiquitin transferase n=1 Tax=Vanilla planifolia TaxID=51239 RepID=A0A835SF61_VANPL|nr:hypothetical protein HPP92_002724 [Vanilla planifolia]